MTSEIILETIGNHIAQDELDIAIQKLQSLLQGSELLDELVVQSGRYNDVMKQIRLGIIDNESANITKNQIRFALIYMTRILESAARKNLNIDNEIKRAGQKSTFIAEKLIAKGTISLKVDQRNSNTSLKNLESKEGKIDINIKSE